MNYATIKPFDVANGPGTRVSLFVSGCTHKCKGCFNEIAWDFGYGKPFTKEVEDFIIEKCSNPLYDGLTLLGGEPMEPSNQKALYPFLLRFRKETQGKTIWLFSGYLFDELIGERFKNTHAKEILGLVDVLVDGEFVEELKDVKLTFRGSSNQRILDVPKSLDTGEPVFWTPGKDLSVRDTIL